MKKVVRVVASPLYLDMFLREQMLFLSKHYEIVGVASPGKEHSVIRSKGIRTVEINIERPIRIWQDIKSLWNLYLFFLKEKPDIVHSLTPKAGLLSMIAAWLARVPVRIHTFTGLLFPWKKGLMHCILKATDFFTCLFATYINPEGEGVKQQLLDSGITKKQLNIIANGHLRGIDPKRYTAKGTKDSYRTKLNISQDSLVFVFTGRLTRDKGIVDLQIAFEKLLAEKSNVHLLLLGEQEPKHDPLPETCRQWLEQNPAVHMVGHVNNVPEWLEIADIFVFPSHREGLPSALLEACAAGLPSIATDICGCQEIICNGFNGVLVPPHCPDELYRAMSRLSLYRTEELVILGKQAQSFVFERYSSHHINQALLSLYHNLSNK